MFNNHEEIIASVLCCKCGGTAAQRYYYYNNTVWCESKNTRRTDGGNVEFAPTSLCQRCRQKQFFCSRTSYIHTCMQARAAPMPYTYWLLVWAVRQLAGERPIIGHRNTPNKFLFCLSMMELAAFTSAKGGRVKR